MIRNKRTYNLLQDLKNDVNLGARNFQVYETLYHEGAKTPAECCNLMRGLFADGSISLDSVNASLVAMRRLGLVKETEERLCSLTLSTRWAWDITGKPIITIKPKLTPEQKALKVYSQALERLKKLGYVVKAENNKILLVKMTDKTTM